MFDSDVSEEDLVRIPRLTSGCDPSVLKLSPAEGFLLSRIDGQTSWKLLREIGGLTSSQVDVCIEEWLCEGVIDVDGRPPRVKRRKVAIPEPAGKRKATVEGPIDESLIDPSLDLDVAIQRDVLEYEQKLNLDYFKLLGVETSANEREIKRAYFALSKRFHPDRYFRKNVGDYGGRLNAIFKGVSEAYELLSDPVSREAVEATLTAKNRVHVTNIGGDGSAARGTPQQPLTPAERLRQRMRLRVPNSVQEDRDAKGAELFKSATQSEKMGRLNEAASNLRLAVAFDPFNREYKRVLGEVQAKVAQLRLEELLGDTKSDFGDSVQREARRLAEEILLYRPNDPETNDLAARVYVELEDTQRAAEYCSRAIELDPKQGVYHRVRASVHLLCGNKGHAVSELNKALELDSSDLEARKMLEALRIKRC
jgi:curved DNA-binding protein CbpA